MITKTPLPRAGSGVIISLEKIDEAYELFEKRPEPVMKVAIEI